MDSSCYVTHMKTKHYIRNNQTHVKRLFCELGVYVAFCIYMPPVSN